MTTDHALPREMQANQHFNADEMLTVHMKLAEAGHELQLAIPNGEWVKLVSGFVKMPADERQRVGASIRAAVAVDPFPADGGPLDADRQHACDTFVNDCILLAALAETVGPRVLTDTVVERYELVRGNRIKGRFN
jgi:hypothetical protein